MEDTSARMFAYAYESGYRAVICMLILSKRESSLESRGSNGSGYAQGAARRGQSPSAVTLKSIEDLQQPGIRELIDAESAACNERLGNA